ncbi:MAG TPA: hypothetical protein VN495_03335 [Candidatus Paceibacterota bacterium]|nr:hypothetical protein [Candidatus Paceibacterota bacterium]
MAYTSPPHSTLFRDTSALSAHRFLVRFAQSLINAFLWVFIFAYFTQAESVSNALIRTLFLYALAQTITMLVVPFAMRRLRGGMLAGLIGGTLLLSAALLYAGAVVSGLFPGGTAMLGILLGAYRALYRVPYVLENAAAGTHKVRFGAELLLALAPLLGALFLTIGGEAGELCSLAAFFVAVALAPLMFVPNVHEKFSWGYRETFGHFAAAENRKILIASVGRGALGSLLYLVLPITVLFATRSYLAVGAVFSTVLLCLFLFRFSQRRVLTEEHADAGRYLDEYTALKEMGLAFGRLALCALLLVVFSPLVF